MSSQATRPKALDQTTLQEIVRRIVQTAEPDRIILFGSAARDAMGPDSDVDLLVVKCGVFDAGELVGRIYVNLIGVGQPVDVVMATPEQLETYRDTDCLVYKHALDEGREIYRAGTVPT